MLTLQEAQEIMRGYMAPRSHAINVFAQTGKLHKTYAQGDDLTSLEILAEAKQELIEAIAGNIAEQERVEIYSVNTSERMYDEGKVEEGNMHYNAAVECGKNMTALHKVVQFVDLHFED